MIANSVASALNNAALNKVPKTKRDVNVAHLRATEKTNSRKDEKIFNTFRIVFIFSI